MDRWQTLIPCGPESSSWVVANLATANVMASPARFDAPNGIHVGGSLKEKEIRIKDMFYAYASEVIQKMGVIRSHSFCGSLIEALCLYDTLEPLLSRNNFSS